VAVFRRKKARLRGRVWQRVFLELALGEWLEIGRRLALGADLRDGNNDEREHGDSGNACDDGDKGFHELLHKMLRECPPKRATTR